MFLGIKTHLTHPLNMIELNWMFLSSEITNLCWIPAFQDWSWEALCSDKHVKSHCACVTRVIWVCCCIGKQDCFFFSFLKAPQGSPEELCMADSTRSVFLFFSLRRRLSPLFQWQGRRFLCIRRHHTRYQGTTRQGMMLELGFIWMIKIISCRCGSRLKAVDELIVLCFRPFNPYILFNT